MGLDALGNREVEKSLSAKAVSYCQRGGDILKKCLVNPYVRYALACRDLRKGSLPLLDDKLKHIGHSHGDC